ncbi:protein-tyrosine kinase [Bifidobacterium goeldii]|uniref:non-specific protein-tyrosine kinase n=1 Tax=Bifidobacterium goeldii TaxID=2306975 RepID=A0A430FFY5_9BIFI|nr:polysaccharide biosynthesis tyrosine autokinase [Bifidobacterium goeldii]RSX51747.1 protein-tyrosine kinase [Bifidobacterium goeldii]
MEETQQVRDDGVTIIDLLNAVRKHVITAVVTLVIVLAAALAYTFLQTPQYTATSELVATYRASANMTTNSGGDLSSGANYLSSQIRTYPQLVKTEAVLQPVINDLGLNTTVKDLAATVTATNPTNTMLVDISVENSDPKAASNIANSVANSLKKQVTSTLYNDAGDKLTSPINLTVVQQAYAPVSPSSPKIGLNIAIGIVGGIILGIFAALIKDLLDTRVRQESDITAIINAPVLGTLSRNEVYEDVAPVIITRPASRDAEDVRRLRTNLTFVLPKDKPKGNVIVVTSAGPSEGKTTTSVNLAAAFAEQGSKLLLIDADVRNPSVSKKLGIEGSIGLTHLITSAVSSHDAIQRYWKPNFHVLPAGKQNMNPGILLNSQTMKAFIDQVAAAYDYVIIDTAPMQVANDAAVFAKEGPQLLVVAGLGKAEKKQLKETEKELETLGIKTAGLSVNFAEVDKMHKSGYYYYYGEEEDKKNSKRQMRHRKDGEGSDAE